MRSTRLTLTIPGEISPTTLGPLEEQLEHACQSVTGTSPDITRDSVTLSREDARIAGFAIMLAVRMHDALGDVLGLAVLQHKGRLRQLAARLLDTGQPYVERKTIRGETARLRADERLRDLTRGSGEIDTGGGFRGR